jgi:hypothetical protein
MRGMGIGYHLRPHFSKSIVGGGIRPILGPALRSDPPLPLFIALTCKLYDYETQNNNNFGGSRDRRFLENLGTIIPLWAIILGSDSSG